MVSPRPSDPMAVHEGRTSGLSLATVTEVLGLATVALPLVGVVIRLIAYRGQSAIPVVVVFSESIPSLAFAAIVVLVTPIGALVMLWIYTTDPWWQFGQFDAAVRAARSSYNEAKRVDAHEDPANAQAAMEKVEADLAAAEAMAEHVYDWVPARARRWASRIEAWRWFPSRPVGGGLLVTFVLVAVWGVLILPFPEGVGDVLTIIVLMRWLRSHPRKDRRVALLDIVPILAIVLAVNGVAIGLNPDPGQPVYVVSSQQAAVPTGWYIQLGDSHDPAYLLTCSGTKVVAVPAGSILSLTYGQKQPQDSSLLHAMQTQHLDGFGLQPQCPGSPPP